MQLTKKTLLIGAAAAVGATAIGGTAIAATGVASGDDDHQQRAQEFQQELAQRLGVSEAEVAKALQAMHGERLGERVQELVADGALTQPQADAITAQAEAGDVDAAMTALRAAMLGNALPDLVEAGDLTQAQADETQALADEGVPIGIRGIKPADGDRPAPTAEHQAEHLERLQDEGAITAQQADEIRALIDAGEADEAEQRIHALMDAERLERLVADGAITQAQADRVQALIDAGAPIGIGGPGGKGRHGGGHHGGGHHGDGHHGMDGDRHGGGDRDGDGDRGAWFGL
jgi:hypothetical protein